MKQLTVEGKDLRDLDVTLFKLGDRVIGVIPLEFSPEVEKFVDERNPGYYNTGKMVLSKAIILFED